MIIAAGLVMMGAVPAVSFADGPGLITPDGFPIVGGKPALMLGLYENPADDAVLREAVAAGFNVFHSSADAKALDRLNALGAKGWIALSENLLTGAKTADGAKRLQELVDRFKAHPALFAWEGPDECVWNVWYGRSCYFVNDEFPAMDSAIVASGANAGKLRELHAIIHDSHAKCLYDKFEAARREFWQTAGKSPPNPAIRMDTAAADARKLADDLAVGLNLVKAADPAHVTWLNHAPRLSLSSLRYVNQPVDMVGCDIYPVPTSPLVGHSDIDNVRLSCVGDYTDRMRATAPGKACAMVLQGFGWRDLEKPEVRSKDPNVGRRPVLRETRFMAYDALVRGANAILYWGTDYATDAPADSAPGARPQLWRDLLTIARELRSLEPALVAPAVTPAPNYEAEENPFSHDGQGLRLSLRKVDGDYVLLAVHEKEAGLAFTVRGLPSAIEDKVLYRLGSSESVTVREGVFRDGIGALGVHVYATSRRFEPEAAK